MNVVTQFQQVRQSDVDYNNIKEALISVRTLKHRNKRYMSYIALCPFKVCYMGRKRMRSRRFSRKIVG
nr:unnamed protein product [Callosobruchus chinensis]